VVLALRADALSHPEGAFLGQEHDLVARYNVSRPTLRQAAGLVTQEQLLQVRRGVGGGYFADRPTFRAVAHMAAIFLQTRDTRLVEIQQALVPIRIEMARLAASGVSSEALTDLRALLEEDEAKQGETYHYRDFLKAERRFGQLVGAACRNNVLHLYLEIMLDLVARIGPGEDIFVARPQRVRIASVRRGRVIRAILEQDADIAMLEARRAAERNVAWLQEDLASRTG
jgi:DNA-binding FadR family transcriptional regulator